jgi:hypothetical protein
MITWRSIGSTYASTLFLRFRVCFLALGRNLTIPLTTLLLSPDLFFGLRRRQQLTSLE